MIVFLFQLLLVVVRGEKEINCDVVIAGGSAASFAAAVAAADEMKFRGAEKTVCLLESTSIVGGQLSSSLITAVDFGHFNRLKGNLPFEFVKLLEGVGWPQKNPGNCWVSTVCYDLETLQKNYLNDALRRDNLRVFTNTVIKSVNMSSSNTIESIEAISRESTKASSSSSSFNYAENVEDWYERENSSRFVKTILRFQNPRVVIDASELGDVLVLSSASWVQGNVAQGRTDCSQSFAFGFYLSETNSDPPPHYPIPDLASYSLGKFTLNQEWTYRKVSSQTSLQAWGGTKADGNDYPFGSALLDSSDIEKQLSDWKGGLNITSLSNAEAFAKGFSTYMRSLWIDQETDDLTISRFAEAPYLRDTRRSASGLGGFVLNEKDMASSAASPIIPSCSTQCNETIRSGTRFQDRVALGDYIYFDSHDAANCPRPAYPTLAPYYVPFRALTSNDVSNLLVAGKTMAQTFAANSATRLHPVEFSTGVAAGVASALMVITNSNSTLDFYENQIEELQQSIQDRHGPLDWLECACSSGSSSSGGIS